uniref:SJCHGC02032 protein n=1 Tax=Schistosoma japonicum TaxID=6182 RepID=Q5D8J8_SCHJA|nr:SJCHGC02032 protein [Schistosoma japonicum]
MMLKFLLYISMVLILINESTQNNLLNAIAKNITIAIRNLGNLTGGKHPHKDTIKTYYERDELIDILRALAGNITILNFELNELLDNVTANHSIDSKAVNNYVDCFTKHYEGIRGSRLIEGVKNTKVWKLLQKHKNDVAEVKQWSSCLRKLQKQFKEMKEGYPRERCDSFVSNYPRAFDALLAKIQSMDLLIGGYNAFYLTDVVLRNLYDEVIMQTETGTT